MAYSNVSCLAPVGASCQIHPRINVVQGASFNVMWTVHVGQSADDPVKDLTGASATWELRDSQGTLIASYADTDTNMEITVPPTLGKVQLFVADTTLWPVGLLRDRLWITDLAAVKQRVSEGEVRVQA